MYRCIDHLGDRTPNSVAISLFLKLTCKPLRYSKVLFKIMYGLWSKVLGPWWGRFNVFFFKVTLIYEDKASSLFLEVFFYTNILLLFLHTFLHCCTILHTQLHTILYYYTISFIVFFHVYIWTSFLQERIYKNRDTPYKKMGLIESFALYAETRVECLAYFSFG